MSETKEEAPKAETVMVAAGNLQIFSCRNCTDRTLDPINHSITSGHVKGFVLINIPVETERLKSEVEAEKKAEEAKTAETKKDEPAKPTTTKALKAKA